MRTELNYPYSLFAHVCFGYIYIYIYIYNIYIYIVNNERVSKGRNTGSRRKFFLFSNFLSISKTKQEIYPLQFYLVWWEGKLCAHSVGPTFFCRFILKACSVNVLIILGKQVNLSWCVPFSYRPYSIACRLARNALLRQTLHGPADLGGARGAPPPPHPLISADLGIFH